MDDEIVSHDPDTLTIGRSAVIFSSTLASILTEESPLAKAPFITRIAQIYQEDNNQSSYFTASEGFGANITVQNGIAQPHIDLNIQEGLRSRHLRRRAAIRLGIDNPTAEEIFHFAVGHELGHLIQGLADYASMEEQNTSGMTEAQVEELKRKVDEYNISVMANDDIAEAQGYFRSIFVDDITREQSEAFIDTIHYTDDEYLRYINSKAEANADFIALWIMGMEDPGLESSPQNQGYRIEEWQRWAVDHRIDATHLV